MPNLGGLVHKSRGDNVYGACEQPQKACSDKLRHGWRGGKTRFRNKTPPGRWIVGTPAPGRAFLSLRIVAQWI